MVLSVEPLVSDLLTFSVCHDPGVLCTQELSVVLSARFLFAISPLLTSIYKNFGILIDMRPIMVYAFLGMVADATYRRGRADR